MDTENIKIVNFEEIRSMAYSVPVSYRFFRKQERQADTWKELYFHAMKDLAHAHPEFFCAGANPCALPEAETEDLCA